MATKKKRKKKVVGHVQVTHQRTNIKSIIIPLIILFLGFGLGVYLYNNRTEAAIVLKDYFKCLKNKQYEEMYDLVETDLSKEEFVARVKNIYEGIKAENITINVTSNNKLSKNEESKSTNNEENVEKKEEKQEQEQNATEKLLLNKNLGDEDIELTYNNTMDTVAGNMSFMNKVVITKIDGKSKIKWNSSVIFPELTDDSKVRVESILSKRGTIYDRNGLAIAKQGSIYSVGLIPGKMDDSTDKSKIADLLGISVDYINSSLSASYVTENTFVPLKKISKEEQELKNQLLQIKGVMITDNDARIYPYKEATSIMTGYVQSREGKAGLELKYNDRLKGQDGEKIYVDKDGINIKTLAYKEVKNGEDIKLTIDVNEQVKIYETYQDDESCTVEINYKTGEIIALVSTPSFDANDFSVGISSEKWDDLQNDERKPLFTRYLASYAPGSSIKPIVGAIGVCSGSFGEEDDFGASGKKWQNDESWKNLYVTTLETYSEPAILKNALVYSDNIYFAKAAIKIGKEKFKSGLENLGFNKKIGIDLDVKESTYGNIVSDADLANSGYGQSEMMVNTIHMASVYSIFANQGKMVVPYIEYKEINENFEPNIYNQTIITPIVANNIKEDLIAVVEDGTGQGCKIEGKTIAGKTGTAEIKTDQNDDSGDEIGWFNAFDDNQTLIISMCEKTKSRGGSHHVVEQVRKIFEE